MAKLEQHSRNVKYVHVTVCSFLLIFPRPILTSYLRFQGRSASTDRPNLPRTRPGYKFHIKLTIFVHYFQQMQFLCSFLGDEG
jgi:hypothetical protein